MSWDLIRSRFRQGMSAGGVGGGGYDLVVNMSPVAGGTVETIEAEPRTAAGERSAESAKAERVFSKSIVISAIRCVLAYVVLPLGAPILGLADVGPWVGIAISLVAIFFNVLSIRRFWAADHRWKWPMSLLNVGVIVLVSILLIEDLQTVFG